MERVRGTLDVPMTTKGVIQVHKDALKLRQLGRVEVIYHSNLQRAAQVARIVAKANDCPTINLGDVLLPWNLGDLQGKPVPLVMDSIRNYVNLPDTKVPGGESFNTFKRRFLPAFYSILDGSRRTKSAIAAHGRTVNLATASLMAGGKSTPDYDIITPAMFSHAAPPGTILYIDPTDLSINHINEMSHTPLLPGVFMIRHGETALNGSGGGESDGGNRGS